LDTPAELRLLGLSDADFERLRPFVIALPGRHPLNLNSVSEPLLTALLANPVATESLISRREAKGFLDHSDFASLGLAVPPMAGFTSDAFGVTATATVGTARYRLARQVLRDPESGQISLRWFE
jgi:general secretion pathway protein K